jgi:hypothetical protein
LREVATTNEDRSRPSATVKPLYALEQLAHQHGNRKWCRRRHRAAVRITTELNRRIGGLQGLFIEILRHTRNADIYRSAHDLVSS